MLTALAGHLLLIIMAALTADLLARAGRGPERWLGPKPDRWATGWLVGVAVYGTGLLGLALAGLFTRTAVIASLPLLALASRAGRPAASPLRAAWRAGGRTRPSALVVAGAALPLLPILAGWISPGLDHDDPIYHLGFPAQCLAVRKTPLEHVSLLFHFPLLTDLTHALPIALGDDRLAKWTGGIAMLAAVSLAARRLPAAGWLLLPVLLTPRPALWLAAISKNDLAAAAFLLAGAVLWRRGPRAVAAVLFGASVAAKPVGLPLIVIWTLCHLHRAGRTASPTRAGLRSSRLVSSLLSLDPFRLLPLFLAPLLPWLVKAWLATGDPVYPHGWTVFAGPFWTAANQASLDRQAIWIADAGGWRTLPGAWLRSMVNDFPLQFAALPLLMIAGRSRVAWAAGAGAVAILHAGRVSRYMLPAGWLISAELVATAAAIPGSRGRTLRAGLAVLALALIAARPESRRAPWAAFREPVAAARAAALGGWAETAAAVARRGSDRVLSVGTDRVYPLPARVIYHGFLGETPLTWSLARSSRDTEHLRRKFRQLGADLLLHNFVGVEWMAMFHRPFPWDDRMLRTYHAFARGRLRPLDPPQRADRETGGLWTFALDAGPGARRDAPVFFLPGAETAMLGARRFRDLHDHPAAEREWRRLLDVTPGVAYLASQLGLTLTDRGRWLEAYRVFAPLDAIGFIDGANLWGHGTAAIYAGRYDEAERLLLRSLVLYDTTHANRTNLAWCYQARADALIRGGRPRDAGAWLAKAEGTLEAVPDDPGTYWAVPRRQIAALIIGSHADLLRLAGDVAGAKARYREAAALAPDLPDAKGWTARSR